MTEASPTITTFRASKAPVAAGGGGGGAAAWYGFLDLKWSQQQKNMYISYQYISIQYSCWLLTSISLVNPRTSEVSETPRLPSLDALFGWPDKYGYRCHEIPSVGANKRTGKEHKNMLWVIDVMRNLSTQSFKKYCIMTLEETLMLHIISIYAMAFSTRTGTMCVHVVFMYTLVM